MQRITLIRWLRGVLAQSNVEIDILVKPTAFRLHIGTVFNTLKTTLIAIHTSQ